MKMLAASLLALLWATPGRAEEPTSAAPPPPPVQAPAPALRMVAPAAPGPGPTSSEASATTRTGVAQAAEAAVAATPVYEGFTATPRATARPLRLAGEGTDLTRRLELDLPQGVHAEVSVDLDGRAQGTSSYALDAAGTPSSTSVAVSPRARLGLVLKAPTAWPVALTAEYEQDLPTGTATGPLPAGLGMPGDEAFDVPLRKANLRLTYKNLLIAGAGVMTSNWGLGLVANDGAHGWEPGSARFTDPRGGDRMLRAFIGTGPQTPYGLVVLVAADKVLEDDFLLSSSQVQPGVGGDSAAQFLGIVSLGRPGDTWAGAYAAYRDQTSADGRWLHATALDLSGTTRHALGNSANLWVGGEAAYIFGATSLTGTPTNGVQGLRQFGAAMRANLDLGRFGAALDGLYASGDSNPDDNYQTGFRANHNYDCGFILFQQVIAAQTARGSFTAGNPQLVGNLPTGGERFPTRGAATDAVAIFPRLFVRPLQGLEVYGGPLFAWAPQALVDPFNTALAGGTLRNAVNGTPGSYLGTELDAGARSRFLLWGAELSLGVEGGVLLPGGAFQSATGVVPSPITSGRVLLGFKL